MRRILQVLAVVCLATTFASAGVLKGRVTNKSEGAPVGRAYILVHPSGTGSDVKPSVDPQGNFEVQLAPGFYDVFVTKVGFAPTCTKVEVTSDKPAIYNPRLGISTLESREIAP